MSKKKKADTEVKEVAQEPQVDWAAIAAMEKAQAVVEVTVAQQDLKPEPVTFEDWWMVREQLLNKPAYYKEILRVDFKARGLGKKELLEKWDWAARQFGLKW